MKNFLLISPMGNIHGIVIAESKAKAWEKLREEFVVTFSIIEKYTLREDNGFIVL